MIRGRLVAINDKPVSPDDYAEDRAKRLVDREFNLSNSAEAPPHNSITAGAWTPDAPGEVSVEEGLAETLGLKLGDTLRFDIGGMQSEARITSLRKVDWGSMHANFFVMYTVATLADVPVTYMGAFRAPETKGFDNALVRSLPERHQRRHERDHRPGAARARPGDPRGRVPVRLHAGGRPGGAVRGGHRHARGARARVRGDARGGRARAACCGRCSAPSWWASACWPASWPASWPR